MDVLTEIHRSEGINIRGKAIHRVAVRGVIVRGRNLLMIHSTNVGDYKFPGGGVEAGETHLQALTREVREESGMSVTCIGLELGAVIEYDHPLEKEYDVFQMTSHYYPCAVRDGTGIQTLDDYERDLGFKPAWIDIEEVIQHNRALLYSDRPPAWLRREIFMLEYLKQTL